MNTETAAKCLSELGNPNRLDIFRLLVRAGRDGLSVGAIQKRLAIPGSTLSHHISHLVSAGLIIQRRDGRVLYCRAQTDVVNQLVGFLMDECCKGFNDEALPPETNQPDRPYKRNR